MHTYLRAMFLVVGLVTSVFAQSIPAIPKPAYLNPFSDPTFGYSMMRIAADSGVAIPLSSAGNWSPDARHVYSKQQPWNSDLSLYVLENKTGSVSKLFLDGTTFLPKYKRCSSMSDYRWHPSISQPNVLINVTGGTKLEWINVPDCSILKSWNLPITVDYIGFTEGNTTVDGRYIALGNNTQIFVVDMVAGIIGPIFTLPACNFAGEATCPIGNFSISPSGNYIDIKYSGSGYDVEDAHRILAVDRNNLTISTMTMPLASKRCGQFVNNTGGWIFPMKHADMILNEYDNNEDVIVGGQSACSDSSMGHGVMVRLRDGHVTSLTDPDNEAAVLHVSTRNYRRPGWAYLSYDSNASTSELFHDEIVAVKLDGSKTMERITYQRTNRYDYRAQAHGVPSPDGSRVAFASNWAVNCGSSCGPITEIKDYVVTLGESAPPYDPTLPPPTGGGPGGGGSGGGGGCNALGSSLITFWIFLGVGLLGLLFNRKNLPTRKEN